MTAEQSAAYRQQQAEGQWPLEPTDGAKRPRSVMQRLAGTGKESAGKPSPSKTKHTGAGKKRHKKVRFKKRFFVILTVFLLLVAALTFLGIKGCQHLGTDKTQKGGGDIPTTSTVSILCSGDLVIHQTVLDAADTGDSFDFTQFFRYLKETIAGADISFVSLEAPLVESNYQGYPVFRSPDKLAEDLKTIGYDVVLTSSNHTNDAYEKGVLRTIDVLKKAGLDVSGSRANVGDARYVMREEKGVKVAIISYVYAEGGGAHKDLNGMTLTDTTEELINTFTYSTFDEDINDIKTTVDAARADGADVVIMYYHWGTEYNNHSSEDQQYIAEQTIAKTDVDAIVGSHPHVPQEKAVFVKAADGTVSQGEEAVTNADSTCKVVPVYYAMGNLLSNQNRDTMNGNRFVEEGYMVRFDITYDNDKGKVVRMKDEAIPYWTDVYGKGTTKFTILPLTEGYKDNEFLVESDRVEDAEKALQDIQSILKGNSG